MVWRVARAGPGPGLVLARTPFGPCAGDPLLVMLCLKNRVFLIDRFSAAMCIGPW